jgi:hypothetical protein
MPDNDQTPNGAPKFDFASYPEGTLFYDRRVNPERRGSTNTESGDQGERPAVERRAKKERRRRVDPTTFEKQYTGEEMEFMNAMQRFKVQSGKSFPTHGDVLKVARELGYRKAPTTDE